MAVARVASHSLAELISLKGRNAVITGAAADIEGEGGEARRGWWQRTFGN